MNRAVIFINGNLSDLSQVKTIVNKEDCLIAVDGGAKHILKLGLTPNVVIGDMDSIDPKLLRKFRLIKYPRKKDKTDFELAVDFCLKNKFQEIIIFGILGDRIDHMMANIFLLAKIQSENQSTKIKIIDGNKEIFVLNKELIIGGEIGDEVSIVPISPKLEGIVTFGLEYKLDNETLLFGSTRGISNVMKKNSIKISTIRGVAVVTHLKANSTKINKT